MRNDCHLSHGYDHAPNWRYILLWIHRQTQRRGESRTSINSACSPRHVSQRLNPQLRVHFKVGARANIVGAVSYRTSAVAYRTYNGWHSCPESEIHPSIAATLSLHRSNAILLTRSLDLYRVYIWLHQRLGRPDVVACTYQDHRHHHVRFIPRKERLWVEIACPYWSCLWRCLCF